MGLNCGAKCAKYVLFAFNIIFFLGGAAVLGVGIWVRVDTGSYYKFLQKVDPSGSASEVTSKVLSDSLAYVHAIAYTLIGVGSFVFVVAFLGCCGACKQWRPLLVSYAVCLIIIMGIQIGVGIAVGVKRESILGEVDKQVTDWTQKYDYVATTVDASGSLVPSSGSLSSNASALIETNAWNAFQVYFGCCGAKSYLDFMTAPYGQHRPAPFQAPAFCCKMSDKSLLRLADPTCPATPTVANSNQNDGCVTTVTNFIRDNAPAVIGVAVGIGLIELVGIIFAFCLCCAIGDKERRYN